MAENQERKLTENFPGQEPEQAPDQRSIPVDVDQRARNKKVGGEQSNGEDALVNSEGEVSGYEPREHATEDTSSTN